MSGRPFAVKCEACDQIAVWHSDDGYDACDKHKREQEGPGFEEVHWESVPVPQWIVDAFAAARKADPSV